MGATISCNKKIGAFVRSNGDRIYIMFEQTYESNCHPHHPHWCAMQMGSLENVMRGIFLNASACEGGMLKRPGGYVSPESYIGDWLDALANPFVVRHDREVPLRFGPGIYTLPSEKKEQIIAALREVGDDEAAETLLKGMTVKRRLDSDSVLAIAKQNVMAWTFDVTESDCGSLYAGNLCYRPEHAKAPAIIEPFAKLPIEGGGMLFQCDGDGLWIGKGADYRVIGEYVKSLWSTEMAFPGSYKASIRALRAKLKESIQFLPTCVVLIDDVSDSMYDYQADSLRRLAKVLGQSLPCRIPVADVVAAGCADWHVRWDVESLAEQGFLRIETPEGAANLAIAVSVPTAKAGMEIVHSGSAYLLDERISRGWRVTRRSDGAPFRMTLSQVDEAVRATHPVQYQPMMTQANPPVAMSLF